MFGEVCSMQVHEPTMVLMDEPYQGFDWQNYLNFWDITEDLRDRGCSGSGAPSALPLSGVLGQRCPEWGTE